MAGVELRAAEIAPRPLPAPAPRYGRYVPRHGHPRAELSALPVDAELLAGVKLAADDVSARIKPTQRRLGEVDSHRATRPPRGGGPCRPPDDFALDRAFPEQPFPDLSHALSRSPNRFRGLPQRQICRTVEKPHWLV